MKGTLEMRGVSVQYGQGRHAVTAVDEVSVAVRAGTTMGLVGESGSGKSSLAKAVVGLVPMRAGSIFLDEVDYTADKKRNSSRFRREVQMVFQNPYSSLNPRMRVEEMLAEIVSKTVGDDHGRKRSRTLQLLEMVGLPAAALGRYPHQFSGGQRQRIAIARALAMDPKVLILDEVTSALDVSVQATILNLLLDLQDQLGLSYLFISHDLSTVRLMSDAVTVMYLGRIVESVGTDEIFSSPRHPYTQALIASIPKMGEARRAAPLFGDMPRPENPPTGCRFHTRCPVGPMTNPERINCIEVDPGAISTGDDHYAACHYAWPE